MQIFLPKATQLEADNLAKLASCVKQPDLLSFEPREIQRYRGNKDISAELDHSVLNLLSGVLDVGGRDEFGKEAAQKRRPHPRQNPQRRVSTGCEPKIL